MKVLIVVILFIVSIPVWSHSTAVQKAMKSDSREVGLSLLEEFNNEDGAELARGIVYHNLCWNEDNIDWLNNSINLLTQAYEKDKNSLALGFLGSAITIRASFEYENNDVLKSLNSLEEGAKIIDKAVNASPESSDIRILRLINSVEVMESSPINRKKEIEVDIDFLQNRADQMEKDSLAELLYYKARYEIFIEDIDSALLSLEQSIRSSPNSKIGTLAQDLLLEWEE